MSWRLGRRMATIPLGLAVVAVCAACGTGEGSRTGPQGTELSVLNTVRDVGAGLVDGDGPAVCAHMYREAQEALMREYDKANCIDAVAVAAGELDPSVRTSIGELSGAAVSIEGEVATITGAGSKALERALNLPSLTMSEYEGDWTLQGSAQEPAIKAQM